MPYPLPRTSAAAASPISAPGVIRQRSTSGVPWLSEETTMAVSRPASACR